MMMSYATIKSSALGPVIFFCEPPRLANTIAYRSAVHFLAKLMDAQRCCLAGPSVVEAECMSLSLCNSDKCQSENLIVCRGRRRLIICLLLSPSSSLNCPSLARWILPLDAQSLLPHWSEIILFLTCGSLHFVWPTTRTDGPAVHL